MLAAWLRQPRGRAPQTIAALVADIYADVDPRLHPVAALSVHAHLLKLLRDGRVIRVSSTAGGEQPDAGGGIGYARRLYAV